MVYKTLKTVAYETHHDFKAVANEYDRRFHSYGTFKTGLFPYLSAQTILSGDQRELFVVPLREIAISSERIRYNSDELIALLAQLPSTARELYIQKQMINEILANNQLAGLKNSPNEVEIAIKALDTNSYREIRFAAMAKMYQAIIDHDYQRIESPIDIRKIYDQLLHGLIKHDQLPDGAFFRKRISVIKHSDDEIDYQLPGDQQDLERRIGQWLKFISNKNIPFLLKGLLAHGCFENLHPFYDGNGRTGRYILSLYLARKLDIVSGLNVSQMIAKSPDSYNKAAIAFSDAENFAEGSSFVADLLEMIEERQRTVIENLTGKLKKLTDLNQKIQTLYPVNSSDYFVLNLLAQSALFSASQTSGLLDRDILKHAQNGQQSKRAVNFAIKALVSSKQIVTIKKNPGQHLINIL
ncbi:Fic family protein [Oenococcus sicerae]|uniref:Fic family protein n=1 Tax=Oenococcus sicerae TaxID=2203724 RepID=UPI0039EC8802